MTMAKISRRAFVAAATAVAAIHGGSLPTAAKWAQAAAAEGSGPASNAEVEARIQWIFTKYGSRLSEAERADIRRIITSGQPGVEAMRAFALDNSVQPATRFKVWRKR
jgi:hypothetical protein